MAKKDKMRRGEGVIKKQDHKKFKGQMSNLTFWKVDIWTYLKSSNISSQYNGFGFNSFQ